MPGPLDWLKLLTLANSDISDVKEATKMGQWKTLAWWEHLAVVIGSQAPTIAAVVLGASNPITLGLVAAGGLASAIYSLAHAHVGANIAVAAAAAATNAAAGVDWSHPTAQAGVQAAQAVADSLGKIVASLPAPATAPAPVPTPVPAPAK